MAVRNVCVIQRDATKMRAAGDIGRQLTKHGIGLVNMFTSTPIETVSQCVINMDKAPSELKNSELLVYLSIFLGFSLDNKVWSKIINPDT